jgi:hypothetical protein
LLCLDLPPWGDRRHCTQKLDRSGVTAAKSLTLSGQQAGIEGGITISREGGGGLALA